MLNLKLLTLESSCIFSMKSMALFLLVVINR